MILSNVYKLNDILNSKENKYLRFYFLNSENSLFKILPQILINDDKLKYNEIYDKYYNYKLVDTDTIHGSLLFLKYDLKFKFEISIKEEEITENYKYYLKLYHDNTRLIFYKVLNKFLSLIDENLENDVDIDTFKYLNELIEEFEFLKEKIRKQD